MLKKYDLPVHLYSTYKVHETVINYVQYCTVQYKQSAMIQNLDLDRALDDVEREFDNSISDMERQRIYSKPSSDHLNHYQQQQQQQQPSNGMTGRMRGTNTPQSSSSMGIQRSSSATRERESSSSLMSSRIDLMHGSSIHAPNGSNSSSICTDQTQQDRKYELLVKKQRLFEEKLKKLDKDCLHSHQCSIDYKIELDRLTEESKADKKLVQSLRGQMAAIKSKMDLFMSNEELREKVGRLDLRLIRIFINGCM
jgi:hypothetical protein